jgi:hypothetical protein
MASNILKRLFGLHELPNGTLVDARGTKYVRHVKTGELRRLTLRKTEQRALRKAKSKTQLKGKTGA